MKHGIRVWMTFLVMSVPGAPTDAADGAARAAMADAMARMMEAMGLFGGGSIAAGGFPGGGMPFQTNPMTMPGLGMSGWPSDWPSGWPSNWPSGWPGAAAGQSPPSSGTFDPLSGLPLGQMPMGRMPLGWMPPGMPMESFMPGQAGRGSWPATVLEGVWEGSDGGLLLVQGNHYRLYASLQQYLEGDLKIRGDRVELTNRRQQFSHTYDFALDQGRLVLRDGSGQLFLYRLVVLGGQ